MKRSIRLWPALAVLALLFLAAHLRSLPPALEDLDSINFAMGVREFDVARHQPHPPGYPVFIALARLSTAAFRVSGASAHEVRGLAIWSAIGGAVLLIAAFGFFRSLSGDGRVAALTAILVAVSPLVWFSALRPLSDMAGLGAAFAALACIMAALGRPPRAWQGMDTRLLIAGAFLAAFSAGFRIQMAVLTGPLLLYALVWPVAGTPVRARLMALGAAVAAVALWAVPLVMASGGPAAYLGAVRNQAGEDFSGVVMLWTHPTPLVAVSGVLHTFVLPWDAPALAGVILALASAGALVILFRAPRVLLVLAIAFAPYAAFHLLFQETHTVRYALPLVPPVAYLVAVVLAAARTAAMAAALALLVVAGLAHAVPAGARFGREPSPVFAMLSEMRLLGERRAQPLVAMHRRVLTESRRARQWAGPVPGRLLAAPRDYEWLELTRAWLEDGDAEAWFVADPRRTDLALLDPEHRRSRHYRWPFDPAVYVGGVRPNELDWHIYTEPGWFLEQGWALTPEIAGISAREGWVPHRQPSVGWVRRRPGPVRMMIGGRHLGGPDDPPARVVVALDDRPVSTLQIDPGFFLHFESLPAGRLSGEGRFARLTVRAESVAPGETPPVSIEQFNLQGPETVQFGFDDGWFEPEYNPRTARSWRWMSGVAALQIHGAGRDVTLSVRGESPWRYYDRPTSVRVTVAGQRLLEVTPRADFTLEVGIPADLLAASGGRALLESSNVFVPGEREGTADRRRLGLRIYSVDVR